MFETIHVIDDFLDQENFEIIHNYLLGPQCPWSFSGVVLPQHDNSLKNSLNNFQFTHVFYDHHVPMSHKWDLIKPFIDKLQIRSLIRAKANLVPRLNELEEHGYHIDFDFPCNTSVFYLNTCDGYTVFEQSGQIINSVSNRLITFPSHLSHTGTTCTDQKCRVVLNLNWI